MGFLKLLNITLTILAAKVLLALVPIFIKFSSSNIWTIGIFRLVFTCLFFTMMARKGFLRSLKSVWLLGPLFAFHWITYFMAVKVSDPSIAVMGLSSYGFILLVYSRFFFKKPIELKYYAGVVISVFGVYLAVGGFSFANNQFEGFSWGVMSALAYAFLPIIHQKYPQIPTRHRAFAQFFGAFIFFLIAGFHKFELDVDVSNLMALLYLVVGGTIAGHTLWVRVTEILPTYVTSSIYYFAIPLTMVFETLILGIEMTNGKILGTILIVASSAFLFFRTGTITNK